MNLKKSVKDPEIFFVIFLIVFLFLTIIRNNFRSYCCQQFTLLSKSFLQGKLDIPHDLDVSLFKNKYYWPLGPLPAILLIPFTLILKSNQQQALLSVIINFLNFFLLLKLSKLFKIREKKDRLWLAFAFFSSGSYLYISLIPKSWFLTQILGVFFILLALLSYFKNKNSFFKIGLLLALAGLTKATLYLAVSFFLLELLKQKKKLEKIVYLLSPIFLSILILFFYNYLRFENPLESGYNLQELSEVLNHQRKIGLFSYKHLPINLYYLLFKGLEPVFVKGTQLLKYPFVKASPWGTSIFLTTPMLLFLLLSNIKKSLTRNLLLASAITLLPTLSYYGIGWIQFGYRYFIDIYPLIFLAAAEILKPKISERFKLLILLSFFFNLFIIKTSFF